MRKRPVWKIVDWIWVHNHGATVQQGVNAQTNSQVLKANLSLNWTGPRNILVVGPSTTTLDKFPVADNDLPSHMPGHDSKCRISAARCKPCANPHHLSDMPCYLPVGVTQYVFNSYTIK